MDIKVELLSNGTAEFVRNHIESLDINVETLIENQSAEILQRICTIIRNDKLTDFEMVEEIVCIFEEYNIWCGGCHDF